MSKLDLNLLTTLHALLKYKSTTVAASHLKTSQSAVSRSLAKIRDLLGDELLVRNGQHLELTARGLELERDVPVLLSNMESIFSKQDFDPAECSETITIAINSSIAEWLVPPLFQLIKSQAPNMNLIIEDWDRSTPNLMSSQEIQLGVNYFPIDLPKSFIQRKVGKDGIVLVCRAQHPLSQLSKVSIHDVKDQAFAVHIMKDWNDKEPKAMEVFREYGFNMDVHLQCRHMSVILRSILTSDMVFFCPAMTGAQLDDQFAVIPVDREITVGDIGLFYSNRLMSDPMTRWLSKSLMKVIKSR
ncbi:LysR family transcriptional regulator [Vibrio comitans]|uniref:LysR family transcriptional regulator n=1 Tax=Vibrio comitans NBRC 102076 TaxID=1219078 RepID=A0A4Y3IQW1_9VIBR|nr:LysR family transcriptional regulator [Vibrio comitans]GEA61931.1 LysR family transcriptional regulator [Vibrio comitans NBRC 102076]